MKFVYEKAAAVLLAAVLFTAAPAVLAENVKLVQVNGETVEFQDVESQEINGVVMLPARFVTEAMGLQFEWFANLGTATVTGDDFKATFTVGSNEMTYTLALGHEITVKTDGKTVLKNNRMLISEDAVKTIALLNGFTFLLGDVDNSLVITADGASEVYVDGTEVEYKDCAPTLVSGAPMYPARFVTEAMGLKFSWDAADGIAEVSDGENTVTLTVGSNKIELDGETYRADKNIILVNNRMYISAQAMARLAEYFGFSAKIDGGILNITSPVRENEALPTEKSEAAQEKEVNESESESVSENEKQEPITVTYNGVEVEFPDAQCVIADGRTLIPVRAVAEAMNMDVSWDPEKRTVTVENGGNTLLITIDSPKMQGKGGDAVKLIELETAAVIIDDRAYVPIRAVMEFFGASVDWDEASRTVIIAAAESEKSGEADSDALDADEKADDDIDEIDAALGFKIFAPDGAENVEKTIVNDNTAQLSYSLNGVQYIFRSAFGGTDVSSDYGGISGGRLSYAIDLNGNDVEVKVASLANGGLLAEWQNEGCSFSLRCMGDISKSTMFSLAAAQAQNFVLLGTGVQSHSGVQESETAGELAEAQENEAANETENIPEIEVVDEE